MKRLLAIAFALFAVSTAQAQQKTTSAIKTDITNLFPSNGAGAITAIQLRAITNEIADSYTNKGGDTLNGNLNLSSGFFYQINAANVLGLSGGLITFGKVSTTDQSGTANEEGSYVFKRVDAFNGTGTNLVTAAVKGYANFGANGANTPGTYSHGGLLVVDNFSSNTAGNAVGEAAAGNQYAAAPTWGRVTEVHDMRGTGDPATGLVGHEVDVFAAGTDASGNRIGEAILISPQVNSYGSTLASSTTVTITSNPLNRPTGSSITYGITVGMQVSGAGIPGSTTVSAVGSTTITLNNAATTTGASTLSINSANAVGGTGLLVSQKDYGLALGSVESWDYGIKLKGRFNAAGIDMGFATFSGVPAINLPLGGMIWQNGNVILDGSGNIAAPAGFSFKIGGTTVIDGTGGHILVKRTAAQVLAITCNAGAEGTLYAVTDANSATFNAAIASGGTNHVMAYCNGTGWTVH